MNETMKDCGAAEPQEAAAGERRPRGDSRSREVLEPVVLSHPQVKICGLTREDEAVACALAGASAIGCVFYPPSPRYVEEDLARSISCALPPGVPLVGVFADEKVTTILRKVERCGLKVVQLHGKEPPSQVNELRERGIPVIKVLFDGGMPPIASADDYGAHAYLVECAGGPLPGGNALAWNWSAAAGLASRYPVILAGGLNAENVGGAIAAALPDAVDISSGVESGPGRKDIDKVKRFLDAVRACGCSGGFRRIFV